MSSVDNIYETCQTLERMKAANKKIVTSIQDTDKDDPHEKVHNLQKKLDEAVTRISELTTVLTFLPQKFNVKDYEDNYAQKIADEANKRSVPAMGGAAS